jgi:hypothetical protein
MTQLPIPTGDALDSLEERITDWSERSVQRRIASLTLNWFTQHLSECAPRRELSRVMLA